MGGKGITITITWERARNVALLSPLAIIPAIALFYLPWNSPSAPAWVQAIGSVGAIIAAWFVPLQHRKRMEMEKHENQILLIGVLAERVKTALINARLIVNDPTFFVTWETMNGPLTCTSLKDAVYSLRLDGLKPHEFAWLYTTRKVAAFSAFYADCLAQEKYKGGSLHNIGVKELTVHLHHINWVLDELSLNGYGPFDYNAENNSALVI
jgi:hypothetical protein